MALHSHTIPVPSTTYDFTISCELNPKISVGQVPGGHRNWISFTGGTFTSAWATGRILPGGQDSQVVLPDLSTRIETNYIIQLDNQPEDEAVYLVLKTSGWRTGPRSVLEALADPEKAALVDPRDYFFRLYIVMECGNARYRDVNTAMWIGSGIREGARGMCISI